ncbi:MAG: protein kinase, partial [Deltaproteobacteria bacterium]|nr:protein kinase [Deltaproteobacteria bacterium]
MPNPVICPHCGARYKNISSSLEGKTARCARCKKQFQVKIVTRPIREPAPTIPEKSRVAQKSNVESNSPLLKPIEWAVGETVLGTYEVTALLGEGGMGRVYKVHHRGWDVDLAVKVPRAEALAAAGGAENFEHEAETWVNLGLHPHTVSCYYVRRVEGIPCVFAEFVSGGNLYDWLVNLDDGTPLLYRGGVDAALQRVLDIGIQFAWGLKYAHDQGLIHQDVKPANVMITPEGLAKVTDFGLAFTPAHSDQGSKFLEEETLPGKVEQAAGTPQYFSPEQATNKSLTSKTDMWSWALSILEMFRGGRTWEYGTIGAQSLEEYLAAVPEEAWLPRMPDMVADLLKKCFREDPEARFSHMGTVAESMVEIYSKTLNREYPRTEPIAGRAMADSLNNRAVSLLDLGRLPEAEGLWDEALQAQPHHSGATFNRGLVHWRTARTDDETILEQMQQAYQSHGRLWTDAFLITNLHLERDDCRAAVKTLDELSKADAERTEARQLRSMAERRARQCNQFVRAFEGHQGNVNAVCCTPDGLQIISGGSDRTVRIWDKNQGKEVKVLEGHSGPVNAVCIKQDGSLILSGGGDFTSNDFQLKLWDLNEGRSLRSFKGHESAINAIRFDRDEERAYSASDDGTVRVWDLKTGACRETLTGHDGGVTDVFPDSWASLIYSAGADRTIRIWDLKNGRGAGVLEGHDGRVNSLWLSSNGKYLLSGASDNTLKLWDLRKSNAVRSFIGHRDEVNAVCLSSDMRFAISAGSDRTIKLWEVETGRCLRTFEGHSSWVLAVSFSADVEHAVSGGVDKTIRLWQTNRREKPFRAPLALSMVSSSETAVSAQSQYEQDLEQAKKALTRQDPADAASNIRAARAQPGYSHGAKAMQLWASLYIRLAHGEFQGGWEGSTLTGHKMGAQSLSPGHDHRLLLSGSADRTLKLWDIISNRCVKTLYGHTAAVNSVSLNHRKGLALSGGADKSLRLWDIQTGRCVQAFEEHEAEVKAVCLSPNGSLALSGCENGELNLWETATGRLTSTLVQRGRAVNSIVISRDSEMALSGSGDYTGEDNLLSLWDLDSVRCVRTFSGHERAVNAVCFSGDGQRALSGSSDNTARLWDVGTGECLQIFEGHERAVNSVCLSADGRNALSGGFDQSLRLWNVSDGQCLRTF